MDPLLDGRADNVRSPKAGRMTLDQAFAALGWGVDDWPSEAEVRKRHRELLLKYHPDKAADGLEEKHTEISSNLNRAKEIILRAHGLKNVQDDHSTDFPLPPADSDSAQGQSKDSRIREAASPKVAGSPQTRGLAAGNAPSPAKGGRLQDLESRTAKLETTESVPPAPRPAGHSAQTFVAGSVTAANQTRTCNSGPRAEAEQDGEGAGGSGSLQRLRNFFDVNERGNAAAGGLSRPNAIWGEAGDGMAEGGGRCGHAEAAKEQGTAAMEEGDEEEARAAGAGTEATEKSGEEGERARGGGNGGGEGDGVGAGWEYVTRGSVTPAWQDMSAHLRLLAQLRDGDKLVVTGDTIAIDSSWVFGGLSRFLTSQGRGPTASWLLRFAADVSRFATTLLNGMGQSLGPGRNPTHGRAGPSLSQEEVLSNLVRELKGCIEGLGRLKGTYASDSRTSAQIVKVIESLSETLHILSRPAHRAAPPRRMVQNS